tara:strand:+ start:189 stop:320 length:132 start_codon:yes stop_codon:yes gene_type:complete
MYESSSAAYLACGFAFREMLMQNETQITWIGSRLAMGIFEELS